VQKWWKILGKSPPNNTLSHQLLPSSWQLSKCTKMYRTINLLSRGLAVLYKPCCLTKSLINCLITPQRLRVKSYFKFLVHHDNWISPSSPASSPSPICKSTQLPQIKIISTQTYQKIKYICNRKFCATISGAWYMTQIGSDKCSSDGFISFHEWFSWSFHLLQNYLIVALQTAVQ